MKQCSLLLLMIVGLLQTSMQAEEVTWKRVKLDEAFRSEGVAAADINKDGKPDVVAGDVWYEAPDWKMHAFRPVGKFVAGKGYSNSFANFTFDINADGWEDIIVIGFPGAPFHWYENPKNQPGEWKEHLIWHSACNESPEFEDLDDDGKPELIIGSQPERQLGFLKIPNPEHATKKWAFYPVSKPGDPNKNGTFKYYHGLGIGDVNGDGRRDVMIPHGWWEAPMNRTKTTWKFHPWSLAKSGSNTPLKAANMYAYDLSLDGTNDILMSSAHNYGVWRFARSSEKPAQPKYHVIDESYSQPHAMEMADINGDGTLDMVTGKRFFAHNGRDPGGKDQVIMVWYEIRRSQGKPPEIVRHEIEAGRGTGIGTQFVIHDMNKDGHPDIVLSNKKGVNILLQTRP